MPALWQALLPYAEQEVRRLRIPRGQDPFLRVVQEGEMIGAGRGGGFEDKRLKYGVWGTKALKK